MTATLDRPRVRWRVIQAKYSATYDTVEECLDDLEERGKPVGPRNFSLFSPEYMHDIEVLRESIEAAKRQMTYTKFLDYLRETNGYTTPEWNIRPVED